MPFLIPGANYDAGKVFADVSMRQQALAQQAEQQAQQANIEAMKIRQAQQRQRDEMDFRRQELARAQEVADRQFSAGREDVMFNRAAKQREQDEGIRQYEQDFGLRKQQYASQNKMAEESLAERREGKQLQADVRREQIEAQRAAKERDAELKDRGFRGKLLESEIGDIQDDMNMLLRSNDARDPEVARELDRLRGRMKSLRKQRLEVEYGVSGEAPKAEEGAEGPGAFERAAAAGREKYEAERKEKSDAEAAKRLSGAVAKHKDVLAKATPERARKLADSLVQSGELPEDRRDAFLELNPTIKKTSELREQMSRSDDPVRFVDDIMRTLAEPDQRDERGKLVRKSTRTELKEAGIDADAILRELQGEAATFSAGQPTPEAASRPADRQAEIDAMVRKRLGAVNAIPSAYEGAGSLAQSPAASILGYAANPIAGFLGDTSGATRAGGRVLQEGGSQLRRFMTDPSFRSTIMNLLAR